MFQVPYNLDHVKMDINRNTAKRKWTPKSVVRKVFLFLKRYSSDIKKLWILFCVQFLIILPYFYWNVPWSAYFKIRNSNADFVNIATEHNAQRFNDTKDYFKNLDPDSSLRWYDNVLINHGNDLDMVILIITTSRSKQKNLGYIIQSAGRIDKIVKNQEKSAIFTFVCNVDKNPANHEEANYLRSYLPYVERFGSSRPYVPDILIPNSNQSFRSPVSKKSSYIKETVDYSFCLKVARTWKSKYVLVIEDDAIARDDFLIILDHVIKYRFQSNSDNPWAALKLFYPEKWSGYAFEFHRVIELCAIGIVGSTIFTFVCYSARKVFKTKFYTNLFFTIGLIFTICSCCIVGRQNVIEWRRILPFTYQLVPSPGCCTVAMLYQYFVLDDLSNNIYHEAFKDKMKADFAVTLSLRNSKFANYMIVPNLFQHIGRVSSLPKANKNAVEFI